MTKTRTQKKIELARDVIKQIQARNLDVQTGTFVQAWALDLNIVDAQKALRDLFKRRKKCEVCAKGSLLVSKVLRDDKISSQDFLFRTHTSTANQTLTDFTKAELDEIEVAFEGRVFVWTSPRVSQNKVKAYHNKYLAALKPKDRLIRIMKRVIRNKGHLGITK